LPLKSSRSRPRFYRRLLLNIESLAKHVGANILQLKVLNAKILVETDKDILKDLARVFGVLRVGEVQTVKFEDLNDLIVKASDVFKDKVVGKTFAVRVKRAGIHDFTSMDVARELGAALKPYSAGVNLTKPDVEVVLEVRGDKAYLYSEVVEGFGGLPIGSEGRALTLFSGGIDSPVAAWLTAKRGVAVDFLHFVFGSPQTSYYAFKVAKLLSELWFYGHQPKFYVVDFTDVVREITEKVEWSYRQVVLRALMYVAAEKLARQEGYEALVTGESLGQASSQTLSNISAIHKVLKLNLPIIRPLIGMDRDEIVKRARDIGTYELSSKLIEACAIAPSRVTTKADEVVLSREVSKVSIELVEGVVNRRVGFDVLSSKPEDLLPKDLIEIDFIPEESVVVDVRNPADFQRWHYPTAIHLSDLKLEEVRDKPVLLYCWNGNLSYIIAKKLRQEGIMAYSLKGGVNSLSSCPFKK